MPTETVVQVLSEGNVILNRLRIPSIVIIEHEEDHCSNWKLTGR